ncbi:MAG: OmpA family protein [Bacteroidales bacterium]|nr:OmpA family protein [Bacteroidales bacterium]
MRLYVLFFLSCSFIIGFTQENTSESYRKLLGDKKYRKEYNKAELYFLEKNYYAALNIYKKWDSIYPGIPNLNFKIGACYLNMRGTEVRRKAIPYFEKAYVSVTREYLGDYKEYYAPLETYLYLGVAYSLRYQFSKALEMYDRYIKNIEIDPERAYLVDSVKFLKEKCYNAIKMINNPVSIKIENLTTINTSYPEYSAVISRDEKTLYFTSRREGSTGNKKDETGRYYEDIYFSTKDANNQWILPIHIGGKINTPFHEATVSISSDGKTLILYRSEKGDGNLFFSKLQPNGEWSKPEKFPEPINSPYWETHACFSSDMKKLYFVSNRPGGYGDRDIWVSEFINGNWTEPENLGPTINTPYAEESPYLLIDDRTLYFSSQGHDNMGGFDIFVSTLTEDGFWTTPENIGYPINTTDDDVFYIPTRDERHAFYSSGKGYGLGDLDIYYMTIIQPKRKFVKLQGRIADTRTYKGIKGDLIFYNASDTTEILLSSSSNEEGNYQVTLLLGKDYKIKVTAKGYHTSEDFLSVAEDEKNTLLIKDFFLRKQFQLTDTQKVTADDFNVGEKFTLRNIYYDFNSHKLRNESVEELNRLVKLMKDVPTLKIEISSHTDSIGGYQYNMKLSQRRAEEVVKYLISAGIDKSRLVAKGYGYTQPIASNRTDEGRQLNRRTEFKILAK